MEQVELSNDRIIRMDNRRFTQAIGKATGLGKFGTPNVSWLVERAREYQVKGDRGQNLYGLIREAVTEQDFHVLDAEPDWIVEVNTESELEVAENMLRQPGISNSTKRP
jgi:GTP:adenosylcobinamide-phosphate guanylyltransferase